MFYFFCLVISLKMATTFEYTFSTWRIHQILLDYAYSGEWESLTNNPFNYLEQTKGEIFIIFDQLKKNNLTIFQIGVIGSIQIIFLDPQYFDENIVQGQFNLTDMDEKKLSWHGKTDFIYQKFYKEKIIDPNISCLIEYDIQLNYHQDQGEIDFKIKIINISDKNKECNIQIQSECKRYLPNFKKQLVFYTAILIIICTIKYFCIRKLKERVLYDVENSIINRISICCIGFVAIYDAYIAFLNLLFSAYLSSESDYLTWIALFFLVLAFFDTQVLWIIWQKKKIQIQWLHHKSRRYNQAKFFIIFFVSLITIFKLFLEYQLYNQFLLIIGLFMIPQIINNIRLGCNPKFIPEYIFGLLSSNIVLPLYFRGYPYNIKHLKPSIEFCIYWVLLYIIQILILYLQYKKGPYIIIPKCLLPKQYNYYYYYRPLDLEICAICSFNLMIEPDQQEQDLDNILISKVLMFTPCEHKFHPLCLKNRMKEKLNCPVCRIPIPPIYE